MPNTVSPCMCSFCLGCRRLFSLPEFQVVHRAGKPSAEPQRDSMSPTLTVQNGIHSLAAHQHPRGLSPSPVTGRMGLRLTPPRSNLGPIPLSRRARNPTTGPHCLSCASQHNVDNGRPAPWGCDYRRATHCGGGNLTPFTQPELVGGLGSLRRPEGAGGEGCPVCGKEQVSGRAESS